MKIQSLLPTTITILALGSPAMAADISWQTPQAISSSSDVSTNGALVLARQVTHTTYGGYANQTVNGVTFLGDQSTQNGVTFGISGFANADQTGYVVGSAGTPGTLSTEYQRMLTGGYWGGAGTATFTLNGLTVGQQYELQFWVADYRMIGDYNRSLTLTAGNTSDPLTYLRNGGSTSGSYILGTFTADNSLQTITITAGQSVQLNAMQLRAIITDANGIWTGADGNWSDATKWDVNTIAQGVDKSATFNGLTPVTATMDVARPIGALLFSGANHTITAGSGSLALDINTAYTSPTVDVASGISATIGAQLTGSEGMTKTGTGTLVLNGGRTYTGTTDVTEGTVQYQGGAYASSLHNIATGAVLDFNISTGAYDGASTTFSGGGTLRKTGAGSLAWGPAAATFALNSGALIDVQEGTFTGGSYGNESWTGNLSDLNVASGATFVGVEANVLVNQITGSGTITTGYPSGYTGFTIGVDDGSSTFDGVIADSIYSAGKLIKVGTGTITLNGASTYSGTTTVEAGTLSLGQAFLNDYATVSIAAGATVNLNFTGTDVVGKLIIDGNTLSGGVYDSSDPTYGSYFTGTGSLTVLEQSGTWTSTASGNWGTSSNWLSNVIAVGSDKTATFSAGTGSEAITVTLDMSREIGNLAFSNATYTLAGSNTLTLNSSTAPSISVASGLTTTISSKLAGTVGLEKNGAGTLALNAGSGDNYPNVYNHNISGGLTINQGAVEFASQYIKMGSITIGNGATLKTTVPWATGSSNPWFNGRSAGSITVEAGGTLTSATIANALVQGLTLNGGSVTAPGVSDPAWGAFIIASPVTADGAATSTISAELALAGNQTFDVLSGSTLDISGVIHNRAGAAAGAITKDSPGTLTLGGVNSYSGNTVVNDGALNVTGSLSFYPSTNGNTNSVSGSATLSYTGTVHLELGSADATVGNAWTLIDLTGFSSASLTPTAVTSSLGAFTEATAGTWELPVTGAKWVFTEADGNLAYVNAGSAYETWGNAYGLTAGSESGDLDNDGLTNFQEFAFGLIPNSGSSVNPITSQLDKTTGQFSYQRLNGSGLTYTIWTSTDLVNWTEDTTAGQNVTTGSPNDSVQVTLSGAPLTASKLFVRVKAE